MLDALLRILALTRKELLAVLKDPRGRFTLLVPPIVQCLIFGYAATYDLNDVPYAVLDQDRSAVSRELLAQLDGSGVFRRVAEEEGLIDRFEIDSAGLGEWHIGQAPDHRAQKAARSRGVDISDQSARQVVDEDFDRFDLLLVMDRSNYAELKARAPHEARAKIRPFLDFAPQAGTSDVPDPFFGGAEGFDHALDLIEAASRGLLASLAGEDRVAAKRGA